jgi:TnpA family transposase
LALASHSLALALLIANKTILFIKITMSEQLPLASLSKTKRLSILTDAEITNLFSRPQFTEEERINRFELLPEEQGILSMNLSIETKVDAIIRFGYFKQTSQFFSFTLQEVAEDVQHVVERYFPEAVLAKQRLGHEAKLRSQQWVLNTTGFQLFNTAKHTPSLMEQAEQLCRLSVNPTFIFRELLLSVGKNKITRPGYSTFQKIISNALLAEQDRISHIVKTHLAEDDKAQLRELLKQEEHFYAVTLLKDQPKNFKPTAVRKEIEYFDKYHALYQMAKRLLPLFEISKNGIDYYASLIEHYTVQSLTRLNENQTCLWLLCFIYHRGQRMLNNLATMFIFIANQYQDEIIEVTKAALLVNSLSSDEKKLTLAKLIRVFTDKKVDEYQIFKQIKRKVYKTILPSKSIEHMADELEKPEQTLTQTEFFWQAVDNLSDTYRPLLRGLLKTLDLHGDQHKSLQEAYEFLRTTLKSNKSLSDQPFDKIPFKFIGPKLSPFIYNKEQKIIHTQRYEYECYRQLGNAINGRSLFISDSINYQSLKDELIPDWKENKPTILKQVNKPLLNESLQNFIDENAKPLDEKIILLNEAIASKENSYVKVKQMKDESVIWTLPYTKKSLELNNPFYEKLPPVGIIRILQFAHEHTGLMRAFTHIKPHYAKSQLDEMAIIACLIACGTNLGLFKMANLCDISLANLQMTEKNYLRLATIRLANDIISNAIAQLPIFRHWDLRPDILHASLDGQKFITEWDNLLARYSQKYYGLDKGVVAYSLIANHVPINTRIIGANEHESHFLFDLIYNNSSDIQANIFSTDTEGSNQLNFLLLHLIERLYAPRYRSLGDKTESIICFSNPDQFKDCLIKPNRPLNQKLILSEEDNIKHVLASLLTGEAKQSNIITKLSSDQFSSKTKRALWEMNSILMTDHILNYIGDLSFRQSIQGALCRGEAYHQLRRHIEKVNGRHFRGSNETQISVWNECARLLANCVLYYNASMLNSWVDKSDREGDTEKSSFIKNLSPVAWTHVNFQGRFYFMSPQEEIDILGWLDNLMINTEDFKKKDTEKQEKNLVFA